MKNYKGGYILISLGLIALSTSFSGSIDYDKVSATKKRIVLTDINVGGTKMPDVTVQPIYGNGEITFSDIYGYDIVVKSDNSVVVSEHEAPQGGTKLYKHHLVDSGGTSYNMILINNSPTPIDFSTYDTYEKIYNLIKDSIVKFYNPTTLSSILYNAQSNAKCFYTFEYESVSESFVYASYDDWNLSSTSDTVTEL